MPIITDEQLRAFEKSQAKLNALEAGGVDNWDGYDFALEELRKEDEREEKLNHIAKCIEEILGESINEPAGRGCGFGFSDKAGDDLVKYLKTLNIPQ